MPHHATPSHTTPRNFFSLISSSMHKRSRRRRRLLAEVSGIFCEMACREQRGGRSQAIARVVSSATLREYQCSASVARSSYRVFQPFSDSIKKFCSYFLSILLKLSNRTLQRTPVARLAKDGTYQLPFWLRTSSPPPVLYLCFSCSVSSCCRTNWKPASRTGDDATSPPRQFQWLIILQASRDYATISIRSIMHAVK